MKTAEKGIDCLFGKCHGSSEEREKNLSWGFGLDRH